MTTKVKMQRTKKDAFIKDAIKQLQELDDQVDLDREDMMQRSMCIVCTVLEHLGRKDVVEVINLLPVW